MSATMELKENAPPSAFSPLRLATNNGMKTRDAQHRKQVPSVDERGRPIKHKDAFAKDIKDKHRKSKVLFDKTERARNVDAPPAVLESGRVKVKMDSGSRDRMRAFERLKESEREMLMHEDDEEDFCVLQSPPTTAGLTTKVGDYSSAGLDRSSEYASGMLPAPKIASIKPSLLPDEGDSADGELLAKRDCPTSSDGT